MTAIHRVLVASVLTATTLIVGSSAAAPPIKAELISVKKIWDQAPHNAFTDLIEWKGRWYCAFREGASHARTHGKLRVLVSTDGDEWKSAGSIGHEELDLRDANLSVAPDGRLMAIGGAQTWAENPLATGTFVSFSDDGVNWTPIKLVTEMGRWMWGATWHDGVAWGVSYPAYLRPGVSSLLRSDNGEDFEVVVNEFLTGGRPTEARIRFAADGTALCLHRRDGAGATANLGVAQAPYLEWEWKDLGRYIGGPNLLQSASGEWVAAGRLVDDGAYTALMHLDPESGGVTPLLRLPSGGDTSYPGLGWKSDDELWMSYYSSHEGKTSIYLAKIRVSSADAAE